ncbi:hypothetical protein C2869_13660 [Saccharobesus litoralis]|uniref:Uncharacterized protein n=1 Tax=Saccharobesus litoralis TaxID=2172099 RepID=A0A2S0VT89_9ALTE|nr:hypothetical protein [Saccharobesus litoralis]AWB67421.1 hypothetical protein C2869_13660 [Saccharobesus litoralis]
MSQFKVIYSGQFEDTADRNKQIAVLAKLTGTDTKKAQLILTAGKKLPVKTFTNSNDANKLVKLLASVGILASVSSTTHKSASSEKSSDPEIQSLRQQVKSLQNEVADLRAQMDSLSEFVDEYVHKKDFDLAEDNELEDLLDFDDDELPHATTKMADLDMDAEPTLLSKALPWIIIAGVVISVAAAAWQYQDLLGF